MSSALMAGSMTLLATLVFDGATMTLKKAWTSDAAGR